MRVAVVILAVLLAGCIDAASRLAPSAESATAADLDWAIRALPFHAGHDHNNVSHHLGLSTPNMELLAWDPLLTGTTSGSAGGYYCGDGSPGPAGRRMAYVASYTSDVAFVGTDVTDPRNPKVLTEFALPNAHVYDLTSTPDGKWVALAIDHELPSTRQYRRNITPSLPSLGALPSPASGGPCGEADAAPAAQAVVDPTPYPAGVLLVDVSDPTAPTTASFFPQPGLGVHSISAADLNGRTVILASNVNVVHQFSYYTFLEVVDGELTHRATYRPPVAALSLREPVLNLHNDGALQVHPGTGQTLAYLADWQGGMVIVDISDFSNLRVLSEWRAYRLGAESDYSTAVHQAQPLDELWDGRHYTLVGPEITARPADTPSGVINLLDTTDPAAPFWVSGWTLPVEVSWGGHDLVFSTHYPALVGRTMFIPMYHGGVWAVDFTDVTLPRTAGVFVPDRASPAPAAVSAERLGYAPLTMQVLALPGGELVTFDARSGAYVFRLNTDLVLPSLEEWPLIEPTP